ncbi:T9SS type A sorting domain-containing protein [bacterium]|nr:T9SS type A sorting domain-containing protein [bacterium]MBU1982979.1 T9SS type A sorting domain-containing protein [bacterium]
MQQTSDGGYILAGATNSFVGDRAWLIKTDGNGDSLWSRIHGGNPPVYPYFVQQTTDGGYFLGGAILDSLRGAEWWLLKTDASGDSLWSRKYGTITGHGDICYSGSQTSDGGYILAGCIGPFSGQGYVVWLLKTDANGDSLWSRTFEGGSGSGGNCHDVRQTDDGGYILGANTNTYTGGASDFWLIRTDSNGDSLWSRTFGGPNSDICRSVEQTIDGGFTVGGSTGSFGNGRLDFWLVKTDANGDCLWSRTYGRENVDEECYSMRQTADGGYILGGIWFDLVALEENVGLVRADANGDSLWSMDFGGDEHDWCFSVCQTNDGGFTFGGATRSYGAGGFDFWLVKTGPELAANEPPLLCPTSFQLDIYPNPFNSTTTFAFSLPRSSPVTLSVFNTLGQRVRDVNLGGLAAGEHRYLFDAGDLPSGLYLARIEAVGTTRTQKVVLIR